MKHGWTGGQFSLWRVLLAFFCLWFIGTEFLDSEIRLALFVVIPAGLAACSLAMGWHAKPNAIFLALAIGYVSYLQNYWGLALVSSLALLVASGTDPVFSWKAASLRKGTDPDLSSERGTDPDLSSQAWGNLFPFGSLPALNRPDPAGEWKMQDWVPSAALFLWLGLGFGLVCFSDSHLEISRTTSVLVAACLGIFGCFFLFLKSRFLAFLWLGLFVLQVILITVVNVQFLLGIPLLLLSFHPNWITFTPLPKPALLFYDGSCGLCHRACRFVLAEDTNGSHFHFAPLESDTFAASVPAEKAKTLPDSLVVLTHQGQLLCQSDAVVYLLKRLGGYWNLLGWFFQAIPTVIRNGVYAFIAKIRHRFFPQPKDVCPLIPKRLRMRFKY